MNSVSETEAAAFKERVLRYAAQHKAEREQRMAADPNYSDFEPLCDVCGEPCNDNQQGLDLWDPEAKDYVALAHFEGCRDMVRHYLPTWRTDYDPTPKEGRAVIRQCIQCMLSVEVTDRCLVWLAPNLVQRVDETTPEEWAKPSTGITCGPCTDAAVARGRKESNRE